MNLLSLLQAVPAEAIIETTEETIAKEMSWFDMIIAGGLTMIPLGILLVIAVFIMIERFVVIRNASKEDTSFMNRIKDYIFEGKIESAINLCKQTQTPSARMVEKGISRLGRPMNDVLVAIENVGNLEIAKLAK